MDTSGIRYRERSAMSRRELPVVELADDAGNITRGESRTRFPGKLLENCASNRPFGFYYSTHARCRDYRISLFLKKHGIAELRNHNYRVVNLTRSFANFSKHLNNNIVIYFLR